MDNFIRKHENFTGFQGYLKLPGFLGESGFRRCPTLIGSVRNKILNSNCRLQEIDNLLVAWGLRRTPSILVAILYILIKLVRSKKNLPHECILVERIFSEFVCVISSHFHQIQNRKKQEIETFQFFLFD